MSTLETPEQFAEHVVEGNKPMDRRDRRLVVEAIRARDKQIREALLAECNEHPGCDGWIRAFAEAIGRTT